ncbi:PAS domain-containing sensor histidine kinase [Nodosilinea nodulosa]|uniref:PAS domain-containing sensor histidine kinase n=1 Tax=Nodosilinea nodulosa TaxID=416001 RepID=UPI00030BFC8A|nr:PAS domain S-box protein [Nodosilinea nodulosa]
MSNNRARWAQFIRWCKSLLPPSYAGVKPLAAGPGSGLLPSHGQWSYQTILENQAELICLYRADTTILYANRAYRRYFGLPERDLTSQSYQPIIYEADRQAVFEQVAAMTCHNPQVTIENRVVVDGEVRWTQWNNHCYCDDRGAIVAYQSVGRDITSLKAIERDLGATVRRDRGPTDAVLQTAASLHQRNVTLELRLAESTHQLVATNQALRREIADRQGAEAQLQASEDRFRQAIVQAPFPIIIHGEDGEIVQVSQAVVDITGYEASQLKTIADWTELAYGERQEAVLPGISRLYSLNRRIDEGEYEIKTSSGENRTWLFSSAPLGQLSHGPRLVISMAADVTQQKQAEANLDHRLGQQAVITQLSQIALSGLDLQDLFDQSTRLLADSLTVDYGKVLELLPDGQTLLLRAGVGWPQGLVGNATIPADRSSQAGYTLASQHPILVEDLATETRFQGPALLLDQGVVSGMSTIIQGSDDRPFGVLGVHCTRRRAFTQEDVNFLQAVANLLATAISRKQVEQALQELNLTLEDRVRDRTQALEEVNRELQAFSYSVAHDLRAPLRAIQGFAQVLQEDYGTRLDDLGREYIRRMSDSAEHLDALIQDLLTYSQLGRTEISLHPVSLRAVLTDLVQELQPLATAQAAQITLAPDLPLVYAQRSILSQVLNNLICNGLKFVAPGVQPQIQIWAEAREADDGRWVKLWIADNGIGIAERHRQRIFRPFERLHGLDAYPGTGIGLSIVERGIERMGGRVGVEPGEPQGSRFWVELKG